MLTLRCVSEKIIQNSVYSSWYWGLAWPVSKNHGAMHFTIVRPL